VYLPLTAKGSRSPKPRYTINIGKKKIPKNIKIITANDTVPS